jgi:UDP-glucose 4-epimerase
MIKVIGDNSKLKRFIKWKPKFNNLSKIVKSCVVWEKKNK